MSEGPIKAERDGWKPPVVSTTNAARVCFTHEGRALCGRRNVKLTTDLSTTVCADCLAAARADGMLPTS